MDESHRYRGLVRTSLTAGVVLSALATGALALGLATGVVPESIFGARELIAVAIRGFGAGALAGGLFSLLVRRGERGQTLSSLSASRVALWGGLAGGSVPLLAALTATGPVLPIGVLAAGTVLLGIGGGALSAGMLRVAQRVPAQLRAPDADADRLLLP
jgi:hypothetical protein